MLRWLHPYCLAAAAVLIFYAHNAHEAPPKIAALALIGAVLGTALVHGCIRLAFPDRDRGALAASFCVLLFFRYGQAFDYVWAAKWYAASADVHHAVATAFIALTVVVLGVLRFTRRNIEGLSTAVGVFSIVLVCMGLVQTVAALVEGGLPDPAVASKPRAPMITEERADLPDIYYIILDGYARNDKLASIYKHDNHGFTEGLKERGFYVAENSRSNYMITHMSLAATLNMRYLPARVGKSKRPFYKLIQKNEAARYLQSKGYRYIHFCTAYGGTETSDIADDTVRLLPEILQNEFMSVLLGTTALSAAEPSLADMNLFLMDQVQKVPERAGPTFAFMHLVLPHNPYVFMRDGTVRADVPMSFQLTEKTGAWSAKDKYIDQLVYVNTRVLEIVDAILRKSPNPPIIIIQSDHGSGTSYHRGKGWETAFFDERTANLNAWYAPPGVTARLTPRMHSVNTFRLLFSELFDAQLPELERKVFATYFSKPYSAKDITAQIDVIDGIAPAANPDPDPVTPPPPLSAPP